MTASNRIKGKSLTLKIDAVDYMADATSVVLDNEEADADVTTFADAAAGGARQFFFTVGAVTSTDASSFWRMVWEHTGDEVPFVYAPHGNAEASVSQPHFEGILTIGPKPAIGGEAGQTYTFETRFDVDGEPEMVTA